MVKRASGHWFRLPEHVATLPAIRIGLKLILLTMIRKSELQIAFRGLPLEGIRHDKQ
jgi:hypothetical protein